MDDQRNDGGEEKLSKYKKETVLRHLSSKSSKSLQKLGQVADSEIKLTTLKDVQLFEDYREE